MKNPPGKTKVERSKDQITVESIKSSENEEVGQP